MRLKLFLSTLSLRRATYDTYAKVLRVNISIHALLAESDGLNFDGKRYDFYFYPRSPCGERPKKADTINGVLYDFYPRSPCGERLHCAANRFQGFDFYPRSPCGERPHCSAIA